jgi:hypothetical protein
VSQRTRRRGVTFTGTGTRKLWVGQASLKARWSSDPCISITILKDVSGSTRGIFGLFFVGG